MSKGVHTGEGACAKYESLLQDDIKPHAGGVGQEAEIAHQRVLWKE